MTTGLHIWRHMMASHDRLENVQVCNSACKHWSFVGAVLVWQSGHTRHHSACQRRTAPGKGQHWHFHRNGWQAFAQGALISLELFASLCRSLLCDDCMSFKKICLNTQVGLTWSDAPLAAVYSHPYVIALLPNHIEVRSAQHISQQGLAQVMHRPFPCMSNQCPIIWFFHNSHNSPGA